MSSKPHISLGELFPGVPPPRLTLRPNARDGADLTFYTPDGRAHKLHLVRSCLCIVLILFRSLKRATDDDEYSAFRDAKRLYATYCKVLRTKILASNMPSYVLKANRLLRKALEEIEGLELDGKFVVDLIIPGYRLGVDDLELMGRLKGAEHMTDEELGRLLGAREDELPGHWYGS